MRFLFILPLFFLLACATKVERYIASDPQIIFGDVNASRSKVGLFSETSFYLELRDSNKALIDVDLKDIQLRDHKDQLDSRVKRLGKGKYVLNISEDIIDLSKIKFYVQKKIIAHKLVAPHKPVRANSRLELISNGDYVLRFRITLRDKNSSPVEQQPDIILEGLGDVSEIKQVKNGVWEFSLAYPEENQILYISIRANGILLERLYRFQHVEK